MKKVFEMNRIIILIFLFSTLSCSNSRSSTTPQDGLNCIEDYMTTEDTVNSSILLLIHSGTSIMTIFESDTVVTSEAQIIYCTPETLKYGYGSVLAETETLPGDIEWFQSYPDIEDYKIIERELDQEESHFITNSIKVLSNTFYECPEIVKDNWQYILYVNNVKVAFGYEGSIDSFPLRLRYIILGMIELVSPLYPKNGYA